MNYLFLIILSIPSIILMTRYPERTQILIQLAIVLGLLILGTKLLRAAGCLKITGLILLVAGVIAYYFLIIEPFLTGKLTTFSFL